MAGSAGGLAAPLAWAQFGWKTSGSGTDTTLTLEAQAAPIGTLRAASRTQLTLKCHERKPMVGLLIGPLDRSSATVRVDREPALEADLRPRTKWGKLWMITTVIDSDTQFFDKPGEIAAALLANGACSRAGSSPSPPWRCCWRRSGCSAC